MLLAPARAAAVGPVAPAVPAGGARRGASGTPEAAGREFFRDRFRPDGRSPL